MNLALLLSLALAGAAPWDAPPFTADPAALAKAAAALPGPEGSDVDLLLEEGTWTFDEAGRATATLHLVYRPLTREAAQSWGRIRRDWAPWHQARPEIRARVILPGGEVRELDPASLVEGGVQEDGEDEIYSDRRSLRAPLPAVDAGVVVEELSTVRDLEPAFLAGSSHRFYFGWGPPTRVARLRVEAPAALPLRHAVRGLALKPSEAVKAGRRTLVWERTPSAPAPRREPHLPPDDAVTPHVAFGTGRSWADVADAYAALVERRLEGGVPPALRQAVPPGEPPERAAQRAMDWIAARVRYTGLELGEAAIVPATPAETLARGYGDCKDLSLLVVAALRAAGHDATLALVRSSWDELSPAVPGIGEFDHAIVRVGGPRPFFLDATDPDVPAGELPVAVQGRRALVAARGEKALQTTQELAPERNRAAIVREVVLGPSGRARATDVREGRGVWALDERHTRRNVAPEKLADWDQKAGRGMLNTEAKVVTRASGLDPLDGPVTVRREADGSRWAIADENEAGAVVSPDPLFDQLPSFLRPQPPEEGKEAEEHQARRAPLVLPVAYGASLDYRLTPPAGFRPVLPLPPDRDDRWGPARFTARYAMGRDGVLTASYTFDLPRRRLSAAEAEALWKGVSAFTTVDGPRVKFERTARALLAEGKGREAIAELQRLVSREPKAARHRNHLALALVELGLGDAGRTEARKAVALAPDDGWSHRVLGFVLQHDGLGRRHAPGCDPREAAAEMKRAVELETSASARLALARVLRLGADGRLYGAGAKLADSAAEYQRAREAGEKGGLTEELEVALRAGRFEQAAALATSVRDLEGREAALVAAAAVKGGAAAGLAEANRLAPQQRGQVLAQAYFHLMRVRRYPLAVELLGQVATPDKRAALERLGKLRAHETVKWDPADASALPARLVIALVTDDSKALGSLVSLRAKGLERSDMVRGMRMGFHLAREKVDLPDAVMADSAAGTMSTKADCVPRAACRLESRSEYAKGAFTLFALWERDGWRLLAEDPVADLGAAARVRLEAGDGAGARRIIGWAREIAGKPDLDGAFEAAALERLAPAGQEHGDAALRLAALALEAHSRLPEPAVRSLEEALPGAAPASRPAIRWALAHAYDTLGRNAAVVAACDEILAAAPGSTIARALRASALSRLGRRAEARADVEGWLRAHPEDFPAARVLAQLAARDGDFAQQRRALMPYVAKGEATSSDYNELAWGALFVDPLAPTALDEARKAVDLARVKSDAQLHTLAAVLAASGQAVEAVQVLRKSVDERGGAPESHDWLVVGQVAEYYGALDAAVAAYRKVEPDDRLGASDTAVLARRRLARLAP